MTGCDVGVSVIGTGEGGEGERSGEVAEGDADVRDAVGGGVGEITATRAESDATVGAVVGDTELRRHAPKKIPRVPKLRPMKVRRDTNRRPSDVGAFSFLSPIPVLILPHSQPVFASRTIGPLRLPQPGEV